LWRFRSQPVNLLLVVLPMELLPLLLPPPTKRPTLPLMRDTMLAIDFMRRAALVSSTCPQADMISCSVCAGERWCDCSGHDKRAARGPTAAARPTL
jgi:hypothetical protein